MPAAPAGGAVVGGPITLTVAVTGPDNTALCGPFSGKVDVTEIEFPYGSKSLSFSKADANSAGNQTAHLDFSLTAGATLGIENFNVIFTPSTSESNSFCGMPI